MCVHISCSSCVQLCATLWAIAHQAPLFMGFSRQEYWSGLSCPPPWDLPDPGMEPELAGRFFTTSTTWESTILQYIFFFLKLIYHFTKALKIKDPISVSYLPLNLWCVTDLRILVTVSGQNLQEKHIYFSLLCLLL